MTVWGHTNRLLSVVEKWCKQEAQADIRLSLTKANQLRLLKLNTWSLLYRLSVQEILSILIPILRKKAKSRKTRGLGISVAMLTSVGAERILEEEIEARYPGGEHIGVWRERQREIELLREEQEELDGITVRQVQLKTVLDYDTPEAWVKCYRAGLEDRRNKYQAAVSSSERRKKAYRWSPWR